ncbi:hypothetical protein ACFX1X_035501 [Malus domestica]
MERVVEVVARRVHPSLLLLVLSLQVQVAMRHGWKVQDLTGRSRSSTVCPCCVEGPELELKRTCPSNFLLMANRKWIEDVAEEDGL